MPAISPTCISMRCWRVSSNICGTSRRRFASSTAMPAPAATIFWAAKRCARGEWQRRHRAAVWPCRCRGEAETLLAPYLDTVAALQSGRRASRLSGSPLIAQNLLRSQDRLIACELEPRAAAALEARAARRPRAKVLAIDGWTAINAYVPPKERRGLVLIDPPFEDAADFTRLSGALRRRTANGRPASIMLWYPIKDARGARRLGAATAPAGRAENPALRNHAGPPRADAGLVGSGLIVVNPPFTLEQDLRLAAAGAWPDLGATGRPSGSIGWPPRQDKAAVLPGSCPLFHRLKLV